MFILTSDDLGWSRIHLHLFTFYVSQYNNCYYELFFFCVKLVECYIRLKLNIICSLQYSLCLLIFFLLEMAIAIMGFVFPHKMQSVLEEQFTDKIIHTYREDVDLQNLIDFAQQEVRNSSKSFVLHKINYVYLKHFYFMEITVLCFVLVSMLWTQCRRLHGLVKE